jgi:hypothetical protein
MDDQENGVLLPSSVIFFPTRSAGPSIRPRRSYQIEFSGSLSLVKYPGILTSFSVTCTVCQTGKRHIPEEYIFFFVLGKVTGSFDFI